VVGSVGIDFEGGWIGRRWTLEPKHHSGRGLMTRVAVVDSTQKVIAFGSDRYW